MKIKVSAFAALAVTILIGCKPISKLKEEKVPEPKLDLSEKKLDRFGITNKDYLSAASKRALQWDYVENDWYRVFKPMKQLKGDLAYEEGVVRRDPSAVIKIDGLYHVWYSKSVGKTEGFGGDVENKKVFPWDRCTVWHATSKDGWTWKEDKEVAVPLEKKEHTMTAQSLQ